MQNPTNVSWTGPEPLPQRMSFTGPARMSFTGPARMSFT